MACNGVAFNADAEELALQSAGDELAVNVLREDLIEGIDHKVAVQLGVGADILVAVRHPEVDGAGLIELLCKFQADLAAALAVLDPEFPDCGVGAGKGEVAVHFRMREIGRVEVEADLLLLCEVYPVLEQVDGIGVAVDLLSVLFGVGGVEVELGRAGDHGAHERDVRAKLVGGACAAGIVAGGLNAAAQAVGAVETDDVVALPAVHGDGDGICLCDGGVHIDALRGVLRLCILIALQDQFFFHSMTSFLLYKLHNLDVSGLLKITFWISLQNPLYKL